MRLTNRKLRLLIKEELTKAMSEDRVSGQPPAAGGFKKGTGSSGRGGEVETKEINKFYGITSDTISLVEISGDTEYNFGIDGSGLHEPIGLSPEGSEEMANTIEQSFYREQPIDSGKVVGKQAGRLSTSIEFKGTKIRERGVKFTIAGIGSSKASYIASGFSGDTSIWSITVKNKYVEEFVSGLRNLY